MLQIAYILVYYKIFSCNYYHMGNMEEGNSFPENASYSPETKSNFIYSPSEVFMNLMHQRC